MAYGRRHQSAGKVGGGASAVDGGESPESVRMTGRNTFRCDDDGYSCWLSSVTGRESRFQAEAVGDSRSLRK